MFSRKKIVAVFLSVTDYGDVIYRHASASTLKALDALRFITGDFYSTHHCILYEKVKWSSLIDRCDRHMYLFSYKALIGKLPSYITSGSHHTQSND